MAQIYKPLALLIALGLMSPFVQITQGQSDNGIVVLDIDKAIEMALDLNPSLRIARDNENVADAQIRETAATALPSISFSGVFTRNIKKPVFFFKLGEEVQKIEIGSANTYTNNIEFRQSIFENGQFGLTKARRIAGLFSDVTREGTELTEDEVILNVRKAFHTVLLSQQVVDVFRETLTQAEAHHDNVRQQHDKGVAAEFDLLRSEVDVADAQANLIEAENNLQLAKNGLKNAIGLSLESNIGANGSLDYKPIPEAQVARMSEAGLNRRPEMKQLQFQLEMARLNTSIQRGTRLPTLTLNGNYQFQGQSSDFQFDALERSTSFTTSLNLRFNIFNGFATSARIQKSEAQTNEIMHQIERLGQLVRTEIEQSVLKMKAAEERIQARQKSVQQAEKAYQIAEVRYDSGIGTQLELFDARLALNRTKTNYLQAIYDYNIALFDWQKAVGVIQ